MSPLFDDLDAFAELCRGAVVVTHRGRVGSGDEAVELAALGCSGGEWVEVGLGPAFVRLELAGWTERLRWDDEAREPEHASAREAAELAVDFVAAALFGELRVIEDRLAGRVLRQTLEIQVAGIWRVHARRGGLGLTGTWAKLRGQLERRVRSNEGRLARPSALVDARCSGQPSWPWSGAAHAPELDPAELAIDGELDLHNFAPKEVGPLVREYLAACQTRGVHDLRIVHGKGKGALRRTVHAELARHPAVESYRLGGHGEGSWGATIVRLRQRG